MEKRSESFWSARTLGRVCLMFGLLAAAGPAAAVDLRAPSDGRAWSVLLQADEVLRWGWAGQATTATLTASNLVTGVSATSAPVAREGVVDGACAIPSTGDETARLVDVTLVQSDGETVLETRTARIRIGQSGTTVFTDADGKVFHEVLEPVPFAWSDAWAGLEAETATLGVEDGKGGRIGMWPLPTTSGYGVLRPKVEFGRRYGTFNVSVFFDGAEEAALTAQLLRPNLGTLLFIR